VTRVIPLPRSITGPIKVERHDREDGIIVYELWDYGSKTYHRIGFVSEDTCDNAKAEADFVAMAMNNAIGALMAIERSLSPA